MTQAMPGMNGSKMNTSGARARNPLLRLFSSVWLGVVLLILLFIYCSIGSAVPSVRQLPALEMTEFEWFHWWPFNALMFLIGLNIIVTTLVRIRLSWINAGVWMIHGGIIMLCVGSYIYFGMKVEGDTPVFRRRVEISLPGLAEPRSLVVLPGSRLELLADGDPWAFQIQSTNSAWPILSDEHKGETAYAVNVMVTPPEGNPFIRQLLDGYPQYTEDVIPGKGRAIKSIGQKLVAPSLELTLDYEAQHYFHVMDSWALYSRRVGEPEWVQQPLKDVPRYHDRLGSRDLVIEDLNHPTPLMALDVPVPPPAEVPPQGWALSGVPVRVTGYLRYAHMKRQWRDGGRRLNPVLNLAAARGDGVEQKFELVAFDPSRNQLEQGLVQFVWLNDPAEVASLRGGSEPMLHVTVPGKHIDRDVRLTNDMVVGEDGPFTTLDGSDYQFRVTKVWDRLVLANDRTISVAVVDIKTPEGMFTRWVADQPERTRDLRDKSSGGAHGENQFDTQTDPRIVMTFRPSVAPVILAGHRDGLHLIFNGPGDTAFDRPISVGEAIEVVPGLTLRAVGYWPFATAHVLPSVVPPSARQRSARVTFSMIRLEIGSGANRVAKWVQYNRYVFPNEQYAAGGRMSYTPVHFHVDGVGDVEVVFSRERRKLNHPVTMDHFSLQTHVGGFSGSVSSIFNYVSRLRFLEHDTWSQPVSISVNSPTEYGGYWFFQSEWDRPSPGDPSGGMNFTGLGVGNRHGVYTQLAGCTIAVMGMMFAFYVKPVLIRRRRDAGRARSASRGERDQPARQDSLPVETLEV